MPHVDPVEEKLLVDLCNYWRKKGFASPEYDAACRLLDKLQGIDPWTPPRPDPCKFCGGVAFLRCDHPFWVAGCATCGVRTVATCRSAEEALAIWNRKPSTFNSEFKEK